VAQFAGPFRVTSHAVNQVIHGTTAQTLTWDVAGTDVSPINVANVKISLSTDGGLTYPVVIADSTPNDGSHAFLMPDVAAEKARIKVEAVGNVFFDVSDADFTVAKAATTDVGATVPATLALTLGAPASFGAFTPGVARDYTASTTGSVLSTAGDATLSVADPSSTATGRLVNGSFSLAQPLQARAGGAFAPVGGSAAPTALKSWSGPTSNESVTIEFQQSIGANEPLRTGAYSKTLTFTLSTTNP
jgi:hypothetical protein